MSTRPRKTADRRDRDRTQTVAGLLRAIDRTLAAADNVRRYRDRLARLAEQREVAPR